MARRPLYLLLAAVVVCAPALLACMRPRSSAAALNVQALANPSGSVAAYQALDGNSDASVYAALVEGLGDRCPRVRMMCARLLIHQEQTGCIPPLTHLLDDTDRNVRLQAGRTLGEIDDISHIEAVLDDPHTSLNAREALALALFQTSVKTIAPRLLRWLADSSQPLSSRVQACSLLRARRDPQVAAALRTVAEDERLPLELRGAATRSLGAVVGPDEVDRLIQEATAPTPIWRLRECRVQALGLTCDVRVIPTLTAVFSDASLPTSLRDSAICALGTLHKARAREVLIPVLASPEEHLRLAAIGALSSCPDEKTTAALKTALQNEWDPEIQKYIKRVLQHEDDPTPVHSDN